MTLTGILLDILEGRHLRSLARRCRRALDRLDPAGSVDGILRAEAAMLELRADADHEPARGPHRLAAEALRRCLRPRCQPLDYRKVDHA